MDWAFIKKIIGITLLSKEEAETLLTQEQRVLTRRYSCYKATKEYRWEWWLRSPSAVDAEMIEVVRRDGTISDTNWLNDNCCVRPVLLTEDLTSLGLNKGDKFEFGGYTFTIISEGYALCDDGLTNMTFRKDDADPEGANNDYETSDVKKYIENWFNGVRIRMLFDMAVEEKAVKEKAAEEKNHKAKSLEEIDRIIGITLLSEEELNAEGYHLDLENKMCCRYDYAPCTWWLRTPGHWADETEAPSSEMTVDMFGFPCYEGISVDLSIGVRPVLILDYNIPSPVGLWETFEFGGYTFTVITEALALCDEAIELMPFRKNSKAKDATDYEKSDVKKYLDKWFRENKIKERNKIILEPLINRMEKGK